jgi:hypothetical protein
VSVQRDPAAVCVVGFKAGWSDRMRVVACRLDGRRDGIPRGGVEPESGDEERVHGATLLDASDVRSGRASVVCVEIQ